MADDRNWKLPETAKDAGSGPQGQAKPFPGKQPDAPPEKGPAPPVLRPARWGPFFRRLSLVLGRPTAFWKAIGHDKLTVGQILWPHVVVLVLLRAGAGLIGNLLRGMQLLPALGAFATSFVAWMALVWLFAFVAGSIASVRGARMALHDALRYAAFGLTPLFLVGVLAVVPLPYVSPVAELLLMPYTFLVLGLGVVPLLGVPPERAPSVVALSCGTILVLWSIMPTLADLAMTAILH